MCAKSHTIICLQMFVIFHTCVGKATDMLISPWAMGVIAKDLANITRTYFTEILNSMETTFVDVSTLWRSRTWGMVRPHLWPRLELWNHINCLFYILIDWGFERNLKSAKKCLHFRRSSHGKTCQTSVKSFVKIISRKNPTRVELLRVCAPFPFPPASATSWSFSFEVLVCA